MRIDVLDRRFVGPVAIWLDGRRVEKFVEMADDERGEVRFSQPALGRVEVEIKISDWSRWHAPVEGEMKGATLKGSIVDRRYDIPGIGMVPLEVSGEVVIQRAA